MKTFMTAGLFGLCALLSLAGGAQAGDRWNGNRSARYDDRAWQADDYWRDDRGDCTTWTPGRFDRGRSYYYQDPYCDRRSSYISDFKGHYHRARHPLRIEMIDRSSGRCLKSYRYDHRRQEWRGWDSDGWRDGSSWNDRDDDESWRRSRGRR